MKVDRVVELRNWKGGHGIIFDKVFWLKNYILEVCQTLEQSKLTCTELETWAGMSI